MKFIDQWQQCWRWFSVHALALAGIIPVVWAELPEEMKTSMPASVMSTMTAIIALCGIVGRLVQQKTSQ